MRICRTEIGDTKQYLETSEVEGDRIIMHRFLVIIEKANGNYSAYSPDLPGCIATGETREEAEKNMHKAIEMHAQGLIEDKLPVPESRAFSEYMVVK